MSNSYIHRTIFIATLLVIFFFDLNCQAAKLNPRQSLSRNARLPRRKKNIGNSLSENKNHLESKVIILYSIADYEAEFAAIERDQNNTLDNTTKKPNIKVINVNDMVKNATSEDGTKCRKEIRDRKQKWLLYLQNPPSEKIAKLKSRIENKANQFTLDEFCQAVAILYQRMKDDIDLELKGVQKSVDNPISKYDRTNFVIPFLLEEYPGEIGKAVKETIAKELQKME